MRIELDAQPQDGRVCADRPDGDRVKIELDAVVLDVEVQEIADNLTQSLLSEVDRPEKVDVARGACLRAEPVAEEQGTRPFSRASFRRRS